MPHDRRLGWLVVVAGGALALAVQIAAPVGVPLYDGVVVAEPYRYLHPTGNETGQPSSYGEDHPVVGGASPAFAAATSESPPQAQLIAQTGAFTLTPGATSLHVSIAPVDAPAVAPPGGAIAGNVYRVSVTDQAGVELGVATCDGCLSFSMRAPDGTDASATLERFSGGAWANMETLPVGIVSMYQSNPTGLGDIAVVTASNAGPGSSGSVQPGVAPSGIDPVVFFGVGAVALWLLVFGFIVWQRVRPAPVPSPAGRSARNRIPSKQRPPRRPGSGSDKP